MDSACQRLFTTLYAILNKKASTFAQFLYLFILHYGIPDMIQCNNGIEFKGVVILFLARYGIEIMNDRPQTQRTQGLVEQANGIIKDKLSKKMEATWNPNGLRI